MAVDMKQCSGDAQPSTWFRRSMNPRPFILTSRSPSCSHWNIHWSPKRLNRSDGVVLLEISHHSRALERRTVGVIPTGTVYAITCDLRNFSAIERLRRIKDVEPSKPLSILCHSFKGIDTFTTGFPRGNGLGLMNIFRAVKHSLPGPPKQCIRYGTTTSKYASRKNAGVRLPDYAVCQKILEKMEAPLISTSVRSTKENEWILDPVLMADVYGPEGPRQPWMIAEDDEESLVNEAKSTTRNPSR